MKAQIQGFIMEINSPVPYELFFSIELSTTERLCAT